MSSHTDKLVAPLILRRRSRDLFAVSRQHEAAKDQGKEALRPNGREGRFGGILVECPDDAKEWLDIRVARRRRRAVMLSRPLRSGLPTLLYTKPYDAGQGWAVLVTEKTEANEIWTFTSRSLAPGQGDTP
jgi:hypothetical protein